MIGDQKIFPTTITLKKVNTEIWEGIAPPDAGGKTRIGRNVDLA